MSSFAYVVGTRCLRKDSKTCDLFWNLASCLQLLKHRRSPDTKDFHAVCKLIMLPPRVLYFFAKL